jgi:hypothetical protein
MNETLRRDVSGFDHAAPTLRSAQVMAALWSAEGGGADRRRAVRPEPAIKVVESVRHTASAPELPVRGSAAESVLTTVAIGVLGLVEVACRAMGSRWS